MNHPTSMRRGSSQALPRTRRAPVSALRLLALVSLLVLPLAGGLVACSPDTGEAPDAGGDITVDADADVAEEANAEDGSSDDAQAPEAADDTGDEDGAEPEGEGEQAASDSEDAAVPAGLSYDMLASTIFANEMFPAPVTLVDGHAEEPAAPGSASMITADMHPEAAWGDLDGDGDLEAVTVVYVSGGGSGTFRYLVVYDEVDGLPIQLASTILGDRVKIDGLAVDEGRAVLAVTTHGPDDPMCCPTMEDTMTYSLIGGELLAVETE
jgi:hypothetical protein